MTGHMLSRDDVAFLRRPLYGFLSAVPASAPPQPRPVWFEVTPCGDLAMFTAPDAPRVRRLQKDPRASVVVAAPVGERERWVSVTGRVTVDDDGALELLRRLARRYWDLGDPARERDLAEMLEQPWLRVELHPNAVRRYQM